MCQKIWQDCLLPGKRNPLVITTDFHLGWNMNILHFNFFSMHWLLIIIIIYSSLYLEFVAKQYILIGNLCMCAHAYPYFFTALSHYVLNLLQTKFQWLHWMYASKLHACVYDIDLFINVCRLDALRYRGVCMQIIFFLVLHMFFVNWRIGCTLTSADIKKTAALLSNSSAA